MIPAAKIAVEDRGGEPQVAESEPHREEAREAEDRAEQHAGAQLAPEQVREPSVRER